MRLDGKVRLEGGKLIQNKDGKEVPEDEFIVFRPHDNAVIPTLWAYFHECAANMASSEQLDAIKALIARVKAWRETHPERCKVADVEPGEIQT
jgi:hypothetical protein